MEEIKDLEVIRELLQTKQYTRLRQKVAEMNTADTAVVFEELEEEELLKIFRILPKDLAADVFSYLEVDSQQYIITRLSDKDAANIVDNLMADDATDLLEEMPANVVKKILAHASAETRRDINHLLQYPEDSAGSIMTVEYVDLKENMTVEEAVARIRKIGVDSETINICYVLDARRMLIGTVALRYLLISPADAIIGDIMHENVVYLNTMMDQEEVARLFERYGFAMMPVVDEENVILGIITVDDIMEIVKEETTEDIHMLAGIDKEERIDSSLLESVRSRLPWLIVNLMTALLASYVVSRFEGTIAKVVALATIMPVVTGMGGNVGTQTTTIIIRGIALGEIDRKNALKIFFKELGMGAIAGTVIGILISVIGYIMEGNVVFGLVVGIAMILNMLCASIAGFSIPLLLKKLKIDPALASSVFVTTVTDIMGFLFFLGLATVFIDFLI